MKLTQYFHLMMDVKRDKTAQQVAAPDGTSAMKAREASGNCICSG